jgi:hypothetical protein
MSLKGSTQVADDAEPSLIAPIVYVPRFVTDSLHRAATPSPLDPEVWESVLRDAGMPDSERQVVTAALQLGVPLSFNGAPVPARVGKNHPLLYFDKERLSVWMNREVERGRYVRVPPALCPPALLLHRIPMGVAPKFARSSQRRRFSELLSGTWQAQLRDAASDDFRGGHPRFGPGVGSLAVDGDRPKWRIISDCSAPNSDGLSINDLVAAPYFEMPSALKFAQRLRRGMFIWKSDVVDAFRLIPVRPRDYALLAFFIDGVLYVDTRLNFGHRLSPYYFVNLVQRPILYTAIARGASVYGALQAYVDDFFGAAQTLEEATAQMQLWLQVCHDLQVPISAAKTFLPSRIMEILGFVINTDDMTVSVTRERLSDIVSELDAVSLGERRSIRRDDLESIIGKLSFVCPVIPGGRTFMREALDLLAATDRRSKWVRLSAGFRRDAAWWRTFASSWNGVEPIPPDVELPPSLFGSDASGLDGLGIFVAGLGVHVPFPLGVSGLSGAEKDVIIAESELFALTALVALVAPHLHGRHILVPVDNTNVVSWVSKGTAKGRPRAMRALRILWRICAVSRLHLSVRYITSADNAIADAISHADTPRFEALVSSWYNTHHSFLNSGLLPAPLAHRASALVTADGRYATGPICDLVEYLVRGDDAQLFEPQGQVANLLLQLPSTLPGLLAAESHRLRDVPVVHSELRRPACVEHCPGLPGVCGPASPVCDGSKFQPGVPSTCGTLHEGCGPLPWEGGQEGGAMHAPAPPRPESCVGCRPCERSPGHCGSDRYHCVLGLPPPGYLPAKDGPWQSSSRVRPEGEPIVDHSCDPTQQNDPVRGARQACGCPGPGRPSDMPPGGPSEVDARLATPFFPPFIREAILETHRGTLAFYIPEAYRRHPTGAQPPPSHRAFVSEGLRPPGPHIGRFHRPPHAARGLEIVGGSTFVRRGPAHSQPTHGGQQRESGCNTSILGGSSQVLAPPPSHSLEGSAARAALFSGGDFLQTQVSPHTSTSPLSEAHFTGSLGDCFISGDVSSEPRLLGIQEGLTSHRSFH